MIFLTRVSHTADAFREGASASALPFTFKSAKTAAALEAGAGMGGKGVVKGGKGGPGGRKGKGKKGGGGKEPGEGAVGGGGGGEDDWGAWQQEPQPEPHDQNWTVYIAPHTQWTDRQRRNDNYKLFAAAADGCLYCVQRMVEYEQ